MPLDPAAEMILSLLNAAGTPQLHEMSVADARAAYESLGAASGHEGAEVASVVDADLAGVPTKVVTPLGEGPFPVLVWIHGGGWVIGSAQWALPTCRDLAAKVGCIVVDVDYRLAPEVPFPGPVDDCVAVTRWVLDHADELGGDPTRVAVGGDSAGGNLSAVVSLEVPGLLHQLLVYPVTDASMSHPSIEENAEGYFLTKAIMAWFVEHYLGTDDPNHWRASPLCAHEEALAEAPPAHVITAEFDPLRDEGEAYADRLRQAGVEVAHHRYEGQIHGFFSMPTLLPAGARALDDAAHQLRIAFGLEQPTP